MRTTHSSIDSGEVRSPSGLHQLFGSLFTPAWLLGWLTLACLAFPLCRGCNGKVVYLAEVSVPQEFAANEIYRSFLLLWPVALGITIAAGTMLFAYGSEPRLARYLWWGLACLILLHTVLLILAIGHQGISFDAAADWSWQQVAITTAWVAVSGGLLALLAITYRRCSTWYHAAMWVQLALTVTASFSVAVIMPAVLFASQPLTGTWILLGTTSLLMLCTAVQMLDGYRALTRRLDESPLRLSLRAWICLTTLAGLLCSWLGAWLAIA